MVSFPDTPDGAALEQSLNLSILGLAALCPVLPHACQKDSVRMALGAFVQSASGGGPGRAAAGGALTRLVLSSFADRGVHVYGELLDAMAALERMARESQLSVPWMVLDAMLAEVALSTPPCNSLKRN